MAQSVTGTPGHVNSMAASVLHFLDEFPLETMSPGDVFLTNDPWKGTGHLYDFVVVTPVFHPQRPGDGAVALFASTSHVARHGQPADESAFAEHFFVAAEGPETRAPYSRWLAEKVPPDRVLFRTTENAATQQAVRAGLGIGFVPVRRGRASPGLVEIMPSREEWTAPLWLVTHVDLHRTLKVRRFVAHLKAAARNDWSSPPAPNGTGAP